MNIADWFEEAAALDANVNDSDFYSRAQVRTRSKVLSYTLLLRTHLLLRQKTSPPRTGGGWGEKEDYMQLRPLDQRGA